MQITPSIQRITPSILWIPYELIEIIYEYLMPKDSLRLSLACQWLRECRPYETTRAHNILSRLHKSHLIISKISYFVSAIAADSIIFKPSKVIYYFTTYDKQIQVHGSNPPHTWFANDLIVLPRRINPPRRLLYKNRWGDKQFQLILHLLHSLGVETIVE